MKDPDVPILPRSSYARSSINVTTEYVYIGAGMNVSLPPVFRKWIASVEVVS
jgi:hypothetical protein